ncbi:MAG: hypothetical protein KDA57_22055 [Planctomycetales bacterium]|nr:hypothetical protein [Planctomycetales bacterium]
MSKPHQYQIKQLAATLGIAPCYIVDAGDVFGQLSGPERQLISLQQKQKIVAFTAAAADLLFKNSLQYQWQGRGCCIVFCRGLLQLSEAEALGAAIHEMGHYLAACDNSARNDTNHARAIQNGWATMRPESQHHDQRWLRATTHLWWRAGEAGHEIPFANVVNLNQYGFTASDLQPLLLEAGQRNHEPVEQILRQPAADSVPVNFPEQSTSGKITGSVDSDTGESSGSYMLIHGRVIHTHSDQTSIDGTPVSEAEFRRFSRTGRLGARAEKKDRKRRRKLENRLHRIAGMRAEVQC